MKTPEEILSNHCPGFSTLFLDKKNKAVMEMYTSILKAMAEHANDAVNEQREIMAKHLNLRNVPKPKISETS